MGHWSVFCAITHAPIIERCVAIWTKPRKYDDEFRGEIANSIFHRGTYDTYGRLEFDKNQKYHEHLTERDLVTPSMFIMESVYDSIIQGPVIGKYDTVNDGSAYLNSDISAYALDILGFKELEDTSTDERYKRIFVHETEPNKQIWSDGTRIRIKKKRAKKLVDGVHDFQTLSEHFPNVNYDKVKNVSYHLFGINRKIHSNEQKHLLYDNLDKEVSKLFMGCEDERFLEELNITENLIPYLKDDQFRVELSNVFKVYRFMYANNLKFGYRFSGGPQDGNIDAHKMLCDLMQIAHKECDDWKKEWETY